MGTWDLSDCVLYNLLFEGRMLVRGWNNKRSFARLPSITLGTSKTAASVWPYMFASMLTVTRLGTGLWFKSAGHEEALLSGY